MFNLSIGDLEEITDGRLRLGTMPPLAGRCEPLRKIVLDSCQAAPGDVFWAISTDAYWGGHWAEDAYARGALGVVVSGRRVEPWAGRFALEVEDANRCLCRLAKCLSKLVDQGCWLQDSVFDGRQLAPALARGDLRVLEDITFHLARRRVAGAA